MARKAAAARLTFYLFGADEAENAAESGPVTVQLVIVRQHDHYRAAVEHARGHGRGEDVRRVVDQSHPPPDLVGSDRGQWPTREGHLAGGRVEEVGFQGRSPCRVEGGCLVRHAPGVLP